MGQIAVLGEFVQVRGWATAGLLAVAADDAEQVRAGWAALPTDVDLVLLTPNAARALGETADARLVAVLP
ncbi:hypothetical protein EV385_5315 [Krasilnikovia cinnamomea]|uniref:ATP synthase F subunit n=1 Tax=Krasilnikovia cinnamomea TaxID=349313 RepID=A0A4Q7ZQJ5_9ACTN|nr:hypothetical protein [Krasilnikovia cinnamomea]RZU53392.1 hypothetical protein EV385_5315 [Krasilnikovia cinnamomea]